LKNKFGILSLIVISASLVFSSSVLANIPLKSNTRGIKPNVVEHIAPPDNFTPLTATPEDLKKYGFPQKPTNSTDLKEWKNAMENAKHYVKPIQTPSTSIHGLYSTGYAYNWAGYAVQSVYNGGVNYTRAWAQWNQPSYSGSADPSFWVGVGGYIYSGLVQAGADSNAPAQGGSNRYEFWVEDAPDGTIWEAAPAVSGGDNLYVIVEYHGSQSSAFLENVTTGNYTIVYFNSPHYDGTCAEIMHEAPGYVYGSWGTMNFTNANVGTSTSSGLFTNYNYTKVIMTNNGGSSGSWEAYPSSASNGSFSVSSY